MWPKQRVCWAVKKCTIEFRATYKKQLMHVVFGIMYVTLFKLGHINCDRLRDRGTNQSASFFLIDKWLAWEVLWNVCWTGLCQYVVGKCSHSQIAKTSGKHSYSSSHRAYGSTIKKHLLTLLACVILIVILYDALDKDKLYETAEAYKKKMFAKKDNTVYCYEKILIEQLVLTQHEGQL